MGRDAFFLGVIAALAIACSNNGSAADSGLPDGTILLPDGNVILPDSGAEGNMQGDGGPPNGMSPNIAGCDIFPPDNPWNRDVSGDPLRSDSAMFISNMAPTKGLHPDWGTYAQWYGIPINTGTGATAVKMTWTVNWGNTESDPLACANVSDGKFCYPIPSTVKIEGGPSSSAGSDRHVLFLDTAQAPSNCTLYEVYNAQNWVGPGWTAQNGAIWHLGSNALRTLGWTSADAAGLPILPGLLRYDEVKAGKITHAIRFTVNNSQHAYIKPATHAAGQMNTALPPMGLRVRLKMSVNAANASPEAQTMITALKHYGMMLADNGSDWYVGGETNDAWSSVIGGIITALGQIHGSDFEVVDTGPIETTGL